MLKKKKKKGISISIAGVTNKDNIEEISSLGFCSIKKINSSKNNFISIDGKECMVIDANPDDDNIIYGRDLGIFALSPSFTRFLDNFFTKQFSKARDVKFS